MKMGFARYLSPRVQRQSDGPPVVSLLCIFHGTYFLRATHTKEREKKKRVTQVQGTLSQRCLGYFRTRCGAGEGSRPLCVCVWLCWAAGETKQNGTHSALLRLMLIFDFSFSQFKREWRINHSNDCFKCICVCDCLCLDGPGLPRKTCINQSLLREQRLGTLDARLFSFYLNNGAERVGNSTPAHFVGLCRPLCFSFLFFCFLFFCAEKENKLELAGFCLSFEISVVFVHQD